MCTLDNSYGGIDGIPTFGMMGDWCSIEPFCPGSSDACLQVCLMENTLSCLKGGCGKDLRFERAWQCRIRAGYRKETPQRRFTSSKILKLWWNSLLPPTEARIFLNTNPHLDERDRLTTRRTSTQRPTTLVQLKLEMHLVFWLLLQVYQLLVRCKRWLEI